MSKDSRVRAARKAAGYRSAEDLARVLGCSAEAVRRAERPGGYISYRFAHRLCPAIGVSAETVIATINAGRPRRGRGVTRARGAAGRGPLAAY